jgi:hypothetical protein
LRLSSLHRPTVACPLRFALSPSSLRSCRVNGVLVYAQVLCSVPMLSCALRRRCCSLSVIAAVLTPLRSLPPLPTTKSLLLPTLPKTPLHALPPNPKRRVTLPTMTLPFPRSSGRCCLRTRGLRQSTNL